MATLSPIRQPADAPEFVIKAGSPTGRTILPPTLRARQAPAEQLQAASQLARLAISYAAEQVPADQAEASLIATAAERSQILDLAADYLGYIGMADNLSDQVTALFMVEHARSRLSRGDGHHRWPTWAKRIFEHPGRRLNHGLPAETA